MTAGTNHADTRSASACTGARLRCASATVCTICASSVAPPTRSARMTKAPPPLTVPPIRAAPAALSTGIDSPVSMDSSTAPAPSSTVPSTGIFSPGRTRSVSPACTCARSTSASRAIGLDPVRLARHEVEQCPQRGPGLLPRAQLEHLAEQHQRDDHRRGFEVQARRLAVAKRMRHDLREQHGQRAEAVRHGDAERDQREHVEAARAQ